MKFMFISFAYRIFFGFIVKHNIFRYIVAKKNIAMHRTSEFFRLCTLVYTTHGTRVNFRQF